MVFNQGIGDEYTLYVFYDKYVNASSYMSGYVEQFTGKDIFIPAQFEYNGETKVIKGIEGSTFKGCSMNSVTISEGIQYLGWAAFENCDNLTTVHIPSTVTDVGLSCFGKCDNLESFTGNVVYEDGRSIIIQSTETRYDDGNEYQVTVYKLTSAALKGLTSYTVPSHVTNIETFFENLEELEEFIIPEGVEWASNCSSSYGDYAIFENCGLKTLRIPDSLKPIGTTLISNCPNLESFTGKWASPDGRYLRVPLISGEDYWELTEEDYAYLDQLVEEGEITEEEKEAEIAWCEAEANKYRDKYRVVAFASKGAGDTIEIPDYAAILYNTFHGCETIKTVVLPNSIVEISGAFQGCKNIENLIVSNNLGEIGSKSFLRCENLREFIAPATIYSIGQDIFRDCLLLERAVLPSKEISMSGRVFLNCPNLKYIELGSTSLTNDWGAIIYQTSFAPGYIDEPTIWEADRIGTVENYDLHRSDAVLVIPRGYGNTYNNEFLDWNYMTKENLVEKDMPSNVYLGIDSETGYNLFTKFVNAEATCSMASDPTQEIVNITPSADVSGEFNVLSSNNEVGSTDITVTLTKAVSSGGGGASGGEPGISFAKDQKRIGTAGITDGNLIVSFTSKVTIVDMTVPSVNMPKGSTFTIPEEDYNIILPAGETMEGANFSYAVEDPDSSPVSLTDAKTGAMLADPNADPGTTATLNVTLKDASGNTVLTRPVTITITAGGVPTAIETIETQAEDFGDNAVYYNLNGVRVSGDNLAPGFYVVKGAKSAKKILVK